MKTYIKHLIQCQCILPNMKQAGDEKSPVFHQFIVFSLIDENDKFIEKFVECNNCNLIHKVLEVGKSEIILGKDESYLTRQKEEIKFSIDKNISDILEKYKCEIYVWEEVEFCLENEIYEKPIVLYREISDNKKIGKALYLKKDNRFKIENFEEKLFLE